MAIRWQSLYAERARSAQGSAIGDLLRFGSTPGLISLAGGFPAPELFPVEAFREAAEAVLASEAAVALQYGPSEGYAPLRDFLVQRLAGFGIVAKPEELLITNGSQQGLDLVARLLVDPGSSVAVEDPSYMGGLAAFGGSQASFLVVPTDADGMRVELLEESLAGSGPRPRLIYALPNFQNPGGNTLGLGRRRQLLELSYRYGIPILEDDPYGELRYEGEQLPSLKALDTEENVIYLGTFSKILSPGVRLGWVVASQEVISQMAAMKQGMDLATNSLAQHVVYRVCQTGLLERHVEKLKPVYRERRDALLGALAKQMPDGISWSKPQGGLFVWAQLRAGIDAQAMLTDAVQEKVAYVPGIAFHPRGDRTNTIRLNFSGVSVPLLREGIRRLGRVVSRWMEAQQEVDDAGLPAADLSPAA